MFTLSSYPFYRKYLNYINQQDITVTENTYLQLIQINNKITALANYAVYQKIGGIFFLYLSFMHNSE